MNHVLASGTDILAKQIIKYLDPECFTDIFSRNILACEEFIFSVKQ